MRRWAVMLGVALALTLGVTAGLATARPEAMPGALQVSTSSLPDDTDFATSVTITPLDAVDGGFRVRGHASPSRPFDLSTLPPGLYLVEVAATSADADVATLTCSPADHVVRIDDATAQVRIDSGQRVDCATEVHERGSLVLRHRSAPASDEPVTYGTTFDETVSVSHGESSSPVSVPAGEHTVAPDLPRGWDVVRARCDNGTDPGSLVVQPGEDVTCTVRVEQRGRIALSIETEPAGAAREFDLVPSWADPVAVQDGDVVRSQRLEPGSYRVRTPTPKGWDVSSVVCDDGSTRRSLDVDPGERLACTVTYTQRGRILVVNEPDADTSAQFTVDPTWGESFSVSGKESSRSPLLRPGTHAVSVDPPRGWALTETACDDGSNPDSIVLRPAQTVTCTFGATQPRFTVASFNVLGHSHTEPGGHSPARPSGPTRMQWTMDLLRSNGIDIVGIQEFQRPQMDAFVRLSAGEYAVFPSPGSPQRNKQNAVAWRTSEFSLVEGRTVMMPYFKGNLVPMPLVRLQHIETGLEIYVMSVHNPASIPKLGDQSRWRAAAKGQQIAFTRDLLAQGIPFFMTGDMNERASYFCDYTASGLMHAAAGGSRGGACSPPPADRARIDWVFGSNDVEFSDYRLLTTDLVRRASDHPLVVTEALILD